MADPNRNPPLDAADLARVRKLCVQGLSQPDIARSMSRSLAQIQKAVAKMGGVAAIRGERKPRRVETWMDGGF